MHILWLLYYQWSTSFQCQIIITVPHNKKENSGSFSSGKSPGVLRFCSEVNTLRQMIASTRIQVEYQNSHKSNSDQSDIFSIAACIPKREKVKNRRHKSQVNGNLMCCRWKKSTTLRQLCSDMNCGIRIWNHNIKQPLMWVTHIKYLSHVLRLRHLFQLALL